MIWNSLNARTINGKFPAKQGSALFYLRRGIRLEMTQEEFNRWVDNHWDVIDGMYKSGKKPTIDRINPDAHYSIGNIRILENKLNSAIARKHRVKIQGTNLITGKIKFFDSIVQAQRAGFNNAGRCVRGVSKHCHGWKFEKVEAIAKQTSGQ
jgi:hypothetical protein